LREGDGDRPADAAIAAGDDGVQSFQLARTLVGLFAVIGPRGAWPRSHQAWAVVGRGRRRPYFDIFRRRLGELGYVGGKNLFIEQRFAECHYGRVPGLAIELAQMPVDVLFTMGTSITNSR
jgi:hypothetical protein